MRFIQSGMVAVLLLGLSLSTQADTKLLSFSDVQPVLVQGDILSVAELRQRIRTAPGDTLDMSLIPHARGYIYQLQRRDQSGNIRTDFVDAYTGDSLPRLTVQQLLAGARYYTF